MKRILVIIPSLEIGGTVSSLSALYSHLCDKYQIDVFLMSHAIFRSCVFSNRIQHKDVLIHSYTCDFKSLPLISLERVWVILFKLFKRACSVIGIDLENIIYKRFAKRKEGLYDLVVGFQEGYATRLAFHFNVQKFAWIHCDYSNYPEMNSDKCYYNGFDKIVCVSDYTSSIFKRICPHLGDNVISIQNLLDVQRIETLSKQQIEDKMFVRDSFTILSIGRLHPVKRFELIPKIALQMVKQGLKFRWYIIGPCSDTEVLNNLQRAISKYSLQNNIFYLGNKTNPYPYFLGANLLVSTSFSEACPMIFNEAKILGVPIISADFASSKEFIKQGYDGLIASSERLSDTIASIMTDSRLYNRILFNIKTHKYNNKETIQKICSLFK